MLTNHFYHEIIRKTIVAFGTLFNNIEIQHTDKGGKTISVVKVPISYGPQQKFLARISQGREYQDGVGTTLTLPRMSFEVIGMSYDATRKVSTMQTFKAVNKNTNKMIKAFMPVPYNINMQLSILSKLNEDAIQIVEQIIPYFQPSFNITVNLVESIGEKKDIPIILESVNYSDSYEGSFDSRRILIYTLAFTAKTYLFGPVADSPEGLIKKVDVDYYTSTNTVTAKRDVRYSVTPQAKQNYDDDEATVVDGAISKDVTEFNVSASTDLSVNDRIIIDTEIMFIRSINGKKITVFRGYDDTIAAKHEHNASIGVLNTVDDAQIEFGDDFGFNETVSFFTDGKKYSPSQGIDI